MTSARISLLLALAAAGCNFGGDGNGPNASDQDADPGTALVGPCAPDAEIPDSDVTYTMQHDGLERSYRLHLPSDYDRAATPLVFNFHGFTSGPVEQEYYSVMSETADREGFAVAYPQGTGAPASWDAGACCGSAVTDEVDDIGFVSAMIDAIGDSICLDRARVYSTGLSNGAFLSHRLACELSDRIAAVAPVAGVMGMETCEPSRAVPVLSFHGTDDALVPFDGSEQMGFPSVEDTLAGWAERDDCTGEPTVTFDDGDAHCEAWDACAGGAAVELCVIDGGGHTWPGGRVPAVVGKTSTDISATERMWDFFAAHPLPSR
jgi:polyhydroxybutyrate depolymerase